MPWHAILKHLQYSNHVILMTELTPANSILWPKNSHADTLVIARYSYSAGHFQVKKLTEVAVLGFLSKIGLNYFFAGVYFNLV